MDNVLIINGPNLNLLGAREPEIYGSTTLSELEALAGEWAADRGLAISCYQSNHEGEIIDRLHAARKSHGGVILNAGALTHYSYAIHDAIVATGLPTVEVHISNVRAREQWRRHSVIAPACVYTIFGRGVDGYRFGRSDERDARHRLVLPAPAGKHDSADGRSSSLTPDHRRRPP